MSNETIFREVDEELRSDRLRGLWRRFGPYVIGAAVAVVLLVAANEGWTWWQQSNAARSSDQFYSALELAESGDVAGARQALDTVEADGSGSYPTLARFREAALLAREGNTTEAIAAYDALATAETNPRLRDLALVLAGYLLVDGGDVAAVQQRVGGLAVEGHPMRNAAREAIGLAQYQAGDLDGAGETFAAVLADPVVTPDLRGRVEIYVAQLTAQGAAAAEAAPAAQPTDAAPATEATEPAADAAGTTEPEAPAEPTAPGN
jgi:hypothetical protein